MNLLLIDISSIYWTRWHATAGGDVNAAFDASYTCVQGLRDGHDAVVACCDSGKSWRHDVDPTYKANRPEKDAAGMDQLRRLQDQLRRDAYPVVAAEGYEADDIIATLAVQAPKGGFDWTTIATEDKDLLQLVGQGVGCISTRAGSDRTRRGPAFVQEKFGVSPGQLRDWLALVGDASDNVPGCPGVGPKTATKLLSDFVTLDGVYGGLERIESDTLRQKLVINREKVERSRELVTLATDVPITLTETLHHVEASPLPKEDTAMPDESSRDDAPTQTSTEMTVMEQDHGHDNGAGGPPQQPPPTFDAKPADEPAQVVVLDKQDPRWMLALEPRSLKLVWWIADHMHQSQLYRKFPNADAIAAAILKGRSMGLDAMASLDCINVIEGKPTMGALAIIGVVLSSGKAEYFECIEASAMKATWETLRKGRKEPQRLTYTIEQAELAGMLRPGKNGFPSNYAKRPEEMLVKQAGVMLARRAYPDVCANVYDPDEMTGT